jgi:hypothetical protein
MCLIDKSALPNEPIISQQPSSPLFHPDSQTLKHTQLSHIHVQDHSSRHSFEYILNPPRTHYHQPRRRPSLSYCHSRTTFVIGALRCDRVFSCRYPVSRAFVLKHHPRLSRRGSHGHSDRTWFSGFTDTTTHLSRMTTKVHL